MKQYEGPVMYSDENLNALLKRTPMTGMYINVGLNNRKIDNPFIHIMHNFRPYTNHDTIL